MSTAAAVDYGDSIMKLSTSGSVVDYFTPHDQAIQSSNNLDFGSAGPVLLVDQTTGPYPHLLISAGKNGTIYVRNRDNYGTFQPEQRQSNRTNVGGRIAERRSGNRAILARRFTTTAMFTSLP